jgi:hypothetical protein
LNFVINPAAMNKTNNLIKVFSGPEASAILLKSRLEDSGISSIIKNDSADAFLGTMTSVVDLYIQESDLKNAQLIIKETIKNS